MSMDWGAWSREAVSRINSRTLAMLERHGIADDATYRWDLDAGKLVLGGATFRLVTVGTVVGDSFLWAWANDAIPATAKVGLERAREFGVENDLDLLVEACAPGGLAQAKECLALVARVLDATGLWIDRTPDGHILFVLFEEELAGG